MKFSAAPRFNFFTRTAIEDPNQPGKAFRFDGAPLVAATCGRGLLTFGQSDGTILQVDRQMQVVREFRAYSERVLACHQVRQQDVLVTVGQEEGEERIKVWNLAKTDQAGVPFCSGIFNVAPPAVPARSTAAALLSGMASFAGVVALSGKQHHQQSAPAPAQQQQQHQAAASPVSTYACLDVHEALTHMVVGTESGLVQLFKGDVTRDRHKRQVLHQCPRSVTCVSLRLLESGRGGRGESGLRRAQQQVLVFVATVGNVLSILVDPSRGVGQERKSILLQVGVPVGCACPMEAPGPVSERDALFAVAGDDAVRVLDAQNETRCYGFEGSKVAVRFFKNYLMFVTREVKPGAGAAAGSGAGGGGGEVHFLTVYDFAHQFIAHSAPLPSEARFLLSQWGGAVVVVCRDGSAHCLAESDLQSKLHLLFTKKNYDLAVRIAKSHNLDADGMADIFRRYGDYLYKKGDMDGAMNEYIRTIGSLEASYVIRRFLDASRIHNLTAYLRELHTRQLATADHTTLLLNCYTKLHDEDNLNIFITSDDTKVMFNAETAIKVLRQAGYYALALVLAKKFKVHAWFVKIQVENMHQPEEALRYMEGLDTRLALRFMDEYGKLLMARLPEDTSALMRSLCARQARELAASGARLEAHHLEDYRMVFVNHRPGWIAFLEAFAELQREFGPGDGDTTIHKMLLDLYLDDWAVRGDAQLEGKIMALLGDGDSARSLVHDQSACQEALLSCHVHGFEHGYLLMCTRLGDFDQLLRHHMAKNNHAEVLSLCREHGQANVDLWVQAVDYFAKRERQCANELRHVLSYLREHHIMSPLMVVRMLANNNNTASLAVVKQYILHQLEVEDRRIEEEEDLINSYKRQIEEHRAEIRQLEGAVKIFQNQKCSICKHDLDLPAVFFFCDHSFHQECFLRYAEREEECPRCADENAETRDRLAAWRHTEEERRSAFFFSPPTGAPATGDDEFDGLSQALARPGFAQLSHRPEPRKDTKTEPPEPRQEPRRETKPEPRKEPKVEPRPEPRAAPRVEPKPEPKVEPKPAPKPEPKPFVRTEPRPKPAAAPIDPRSAAAYASLAEARTATRAKTEQASARQAKNIFQDTRRLPAAAPPSAIGNFAPAVPQPQQQQQQQSRGPPPPPPPPNPFEETAGNPFEEEGPAEEDEEYPEELNPFA